MLTPGRPVPVLTLCHQAPGRVATEMPIFKSLVWLDPPNKSRRKRNSNPGSSALEAGALTTRPTRRWTHRIVSSLTAAVGNLSRPYSPVFSTGLDFAWFTFLFISDENLGILGHEKNSVLRFLFLFWFVWSPFLTCNRDERPFETDIKGRLSSSLTFL